MRWIQSCLNPVEAWKCLDRFGVGPQKLPHSFPHAHKCTMHILFPISVCLLSFGWLYIDRYGIVCCVGRRALGGVWDKRPVWRWQNGGGPEGAKLITVFSLAPPAPKWQTNNNTPTRGKTHITTIISFPLSPMSYGLHYILSIGAFNEKVYHNRERGKKHYSEIHKHLNDSEEN